MSEAMIRTAGVHKRFGSVEALKGIDLEVSIGTVFGLLGPNGAGKTTAVRVLTTLITPDEGSASVAGFDVVRDAEILRSRVGLAGQFAAIDENLTGLENVEMVGRLYHLSKAEAHGRAGEVLERFGLSDAADRVARTYSGGMRRRLDLCSSLVGRPQVLFLDEPTTGLDPRSRLGLWDMIRELQDEGTTLLLTTQYLEEADRLTDRIAVIDLGTVIAEGTADELKDKIGGEMIQLHVGDGMQAERASSALAGVGAGEPAVDPAEGRIRLPVGSTGSAALVEVIRRMDEANIEIRDIALHRPTLDDVFLSLTGHAAEDDQEPEETADDGKRSRRRQKERV